MTSGKLVINVKKYLMIWFTALVGCAPVYQNSPKGWVGFILAPTNTEMNQFCKRIAQNARSNPRSNDNHSIVKYFKGTSVEFISYIPYTYSVCHTAGLQGDKLPGFSSFSLTSFQLRGPKVPKDQIVFSLELVDSSGTPIQIIPDFTSSEKRQSDNTTEFNYSKNQWTDQERESMMNASRFTVVIKQGSDEERVVFQSSDFQKYL
jgi:hypothetical protein